MRRGIGLRGYAQQDPLNEFRREAFRLYEELRGLIRHGVASSIFRVTVQHQPPADAGLSQALAAGAEAIRTGGGDGGPARRPARGRLPQRRVPPPRRRRDRRLGHPARRRAGCPGRAQRPRVARRHARAPAGGGNGARPEPAAARGRGTRRPASGSGATIRAGAARGRSTRSATGSDRPRADAWLAPSWHTTVWPTAPRRRAREERPIRRHTTVTPTGADGRASPGCRSDMSDGAAVVCRSSAVDAVREAKRRHPCTTRRSWRLDGRW